MGNQKFVLIFDFDHVSPVRLFVDFLKYYKDRIFFIINRFLKFVLTYMSIILLDSSCLEAFLKEKVVLDCEFVSKKGKSLGNVNLRELCCI